MPTIKSEEYPGLGITEAIESAKKVVDQFKGKPFTKETLAGVLGHTAKSGTFFQKVADLRRFGIIEGRGDSYRATGLAQRLAIPGQDFSSAVSEMYFTVPLYKFIWDHYQGAPPRDVEDVRIILQNHTGADRAEAQEHAEKLRSIYIEAISKVGSGGVVAPQAPLAKTMAQSQHTTLAAGPTIPAGMVVIQTPTGFAQQFPFTPSGVELGKHLFSESFFKYLKEEAAKVAKTESQPEKEVKK